MRISLMRVHTNPNPSLTLTLASLTLASQLQSPPWLSMVVSTDAPLLPTKVLTPLQLVRHPPIGVRVRLEVGLQESDQGRGSLATSLPRPTVRIRVRMRIKTMLRCGVRARLMRLPPPTLATLIGGTAASTAAQLRGPDPSSLAPRMSVEAAATAALPRPRKYLQPGLAPASGLVLGLVSARLRTRAGGTKG